MVPLSGNVDGFKSGMNCDLFSVNISKLNIRSNQEAEVSVLLFRICDEAYV